MKYIEVRKGSKKSLAALAVLGTLTLAGVTSTVQPVQAQDNSRWGNRNVTITGTVVDSGNQTGVVRIQQSNGTIYSAETANADRFRVGQTVKATGRLRNNTIRNATVTRTGGWNNGNNNPGGWNGGGNGNNTNVTITGTVVDSLNQTNVVRIQQGNGRIYSAQTSRAERFSIGESVEAKGYLRGSTISNATVRSLGGGGGWNGGGSSNVTIVGTVVDSQNQVNVVRVQQNNGRVYTAQTGRAERFTVGESVEVKGRLQGSTIANATVRRLGGGSGGGANTRITFSGIVQDSGNQINTLRVRSDNGTVYNVSTNNAANYRLNDRVRVTGFYNGSVVTGAQINRN